MLPNGFCLNVMNKINEFLWRQWSQLGVAGGNAWKKSWIIDPENLLLFTLDAGRFDPRLFDEVMDWLIVNERWISLQRINGLAKFCDRQTVRTLSAVARYMDRQKTHIRWKSLAQGRSDSLDDPIPFFLRTDFKAIPALGESDPFFIKVGWIRSPISVRGLSNSVSSLSPSNAMIHLRMLFGVHPRAEMIAFLMAHDHASVSDIMHRSGYSRPSIHEVLNDLSKGGFISANKINSRYIYSLETDRWKRFLLSEDEAFHWPDWAAIYSALRILLSYLRDVQTSPMSDYILRSKSVRLLVDMQHELAASGIAMPWMKPVTIDHVLDQLPNQILMLLDLLNNPK